MRVTITLGGDYESDDISKGDYDGDGDDHESEHNNRLSMKVMITMG